MLRCLAFIIAVGLTLPLAADEGQKDEQKPELIPAPKAKEPDVIYVIPPRPQPGTREIWQYYGVDTRGRFVPRVYYTPSVSFYLGTGEIYPWTTTRPTLYMPYVVD